jgi:hypothetical protein
MMKEDTRSLRNVIHLTFRALTLTEVDQSLLSATLGDILTFTFFGRLAGYFEVPGSH